jgi:hypothetical protein
MRTTTVIGMTTVFETTSHDVAVVPAARHAVQTWLDGHGIDGAAGDAVVLVVDELFTNAIRNTFGLVRLVMSDADGDVRVAVFDESLRLPNPLLALPDDDRPHGLAIVERTANRWGSGHTTFDGHLGKVVWAVLPSR